MSPLTFESDIFLMKSTVSCCTAFATIGRHIGPTHDKSMDKREMRENEHSELYSQN